MSNTQPEFSPLRSALFPVSTWELRKFVPLAIMIFITIFNFTLLRNAKDALFVTAPGSGAESISFLKLWGVLPMTILCSMLYVKLRQMMSFEHGYYVILGIFMSFFLLFNLVLYPNVEFLHPSVAWIQSLKDAYPRFQHAFPLLGNWSYALFYIFSELWGTFCLTILFWQFANDIVGPNEAKRFYPLLILTSNIGTILLSMVMKYLSKFSGYYIVTYSNYTILVLATLMLFTFRWVNAKVLIDPKYTQDVSQRTKKPKVKLGFMDSMKQLAQSEYVGLIAIMVMSYGVMTNFIEQTWKSQVKELYPTLEAYYGFMSSYVFWTGVIPMIFVYMGKGIVRRYGWLVVAIITPIIMTITGIVFFSYMVFTEELSSVLIYFGGLSPLVFAVFFGMVGVILSKSSKYSFFDPAKEMAFIPLEHDLKVTGKAAADGVGGRLGKSGGGLIQQFLLVATAGNQMSIAPYLGFFVVIISAIWLVSVVRLSKLYKVQLEDSMKAE